MRQGKCNNFATCATAASRTVVRVADNADFLCPECRGELKKLRLTDRFPAVFVGFLIVQLLFFGFVAWKWAAGGTRASAKTNGNVVLRLAGSNTIGASLGPALAQEFLKSLGATNIQMRPGETAEEKNVRGTLPGASSPSVITIAAHGSATAFSGLAEGKCDVGMSSRKIKPDEVRVLASLGDMTAIGSEHVLGLDGIAVIVNTGNPTQSLRVDQIAQIFSGAVTNWSQVGGNPGSITVYARDDKSGTYDTFKALVLGSNALVNTAKRFEDSNQLSDSVAADPNAIGFIGLPYIHSAKAISIAAPGAKGLLPNLLTVATEDYPLSRRLYLYTPGNSQNKLARPFVEFALSKQGQDVVGNIGFVSQNIKLEPATVAEDAPRGYRALTQGALRASLDFRFRTGKSDLDNKALVDLDRMAVFFSDFRYRGSDVLLLGFADNTGVRVANMQLSRDRAKTVKDEFERRGLQPSIVEGFGPELPVASNESEEGREKNRRVEVWLKPAATVRE